MDIITIFFSVLLIVGIPLLLFWGSASAVKNEIIIPSKVKKVFKKLISDDGFRELDPNGEEFRQLGNNLRDVIGQGLSIKIKRAVIKKNAHIFYISEITHEKRSGRGRYRTLETGYHSNLFVPVELGIPGVVSIRKTAFDAHDKTGQGASPSYSRSPDDFDKTFSVKSIAPKVSSGIATQELKGLFLRYNEKYPFAESAESPDSYKINREVRLASGGISISGNRTWYKGDFADMVEFARELIPLLEKNAPPSKEVGKEEEEIYRADMD